MKALLLAIEIETLYNSMDILEVVKEFEKYSNQIIPEQVLINFKFTGLSNVDLLTSDFLNNYGLKNLYQC